MIHYLSHADELKKACKNFGKVVTIDTEFIASNLSYYPRLCLVQIFNGSEVYLIDTLNEKMDLSPLFKVLEDENIQKVFHSSFIDIQIFQMCYNTKVRNIFDTQVAYMFLHNEQPISYARFIEKYLGIHLDKSLQVSSWDKRPLSSEQKAYAAADVTYLYKTIDKLKEELKESGKEAWFLQEMKNLEDYDLYKTTTENIYRKIKVNSKAPMVLLKLKELAKIREEEAMEKNTYPQSIITDTHLIKIAFGRDVENLIRNNVNDKETQSKMLLTIKNLNKLSPIEVKEKLGKIVDHGTAKIAKKIKSIIKDIASKNKISEQLIYQNRDITDLVLYPEQKDIDIFKGWRKELLGDKNIKKIIDVARKAK